MYDSIVLAESFQAVAAAIVVAAILAAALVCGCLAEKWEERRGG